MRDGEQTNAVSFVAEEKLAIAKLLLESAKVDRIEIASARASPGEFETAKKICTWAKQSGFLDRIEVLGFVDAGKSVEWIKQAGCKTINLLCKGSELHCIKQLCKKPEEHFADIKQAILIAQEEGFAVNAYLEDWSNGAQQSKQYVFRLAKLLGESKVKRIFLADTLGILPPKKTFELVREMAGGFPKAVFEFHAHNDYGLATANALSAAEAGAAGLHVTVNGLGERAGNAALDETIIALHDHAGFKTGVDEKQLSMISQIVETFSGQRIAANKPICGENVFVQTAGIHADGDKKAQLYASALLPERFARQREYALGKLSGKASIEMNLRQLGIELQKEQLAKVVKKVVELGDKKQLVSAADLPFILEDVLQNGAKEKIKIAYFRVETEKAKQPSATVSIKANNKVFFESASGDGGYDAFMKALEKISKQAGFALAELVDYKVRIPPGGKTDALVETTIHWKKNGFEFRTTGVDSDQLAAAIKATEKMLNFGSMKKPQGF